MKKTTIIKRILIILFIYATIIALTMYIPYILEQRRLTQHAFVTESRLSLFEVDLMLSLYHVNSNPELKSGWYYDLDIDKWPDYSNYKIEPSDDTYKVVALLNYDLFDIAAKQNHKSIDAAAKYGFSSDNRLTVDWVMENCAKACDILNMLSTLDYFSYRSSEAIQKRYDELIEPSNSPDSLQEESIEPAVELPSE